MTYAEAYKIAARFVKPGDEPYGTAPHDFIKHWGLTDQILYECLLKTDSNEHYFERRERLTAIIKLTNVLLPLEVKPDAKNS